MSCNYLLRLIVCITFVSLPAWAELSPINLKGMANCMKPGYEQLAPAIGALFWASPLIQNSYKFGDDSQGMVQLTKNLFSFDIDGITFDITSSYLKIARYLIPEDIGKIIGAIYIYSNSDKTEKDLQVLKTGIYDVIRLRVAKDKAAIKQAIIDGFQSTVDRQKNQIIALAEKLKTRIVLKKKFDASFAWKKKPQELEETFPPEWKFLDTLIAKTIPTKELVSEMITLLNAPVEEFYRTHLAELIKLSQQLIANNGELTREQSTKSINNQFFKTNAGTAEFKPHERTSEFSLYKSIIDAVQEEQQGLYPHSLAIDILLAWLWKYASEPTDLKHYLEAMAESIKKQDQVFLWPEPLSQFSRNDYDQITSFEPLSLDQLVFVFEGYNLYVNPLPPEVKMTGKMEYKAHNGKWYTGVPDCGETALRNAFDAFFFDPKTKQFDLSLIKSVSNNANLINFYTKYKTAEKINTLQAHNDWATVVSELPKVKYCRNNVVEIDAGIQNMLAVINQLIPEANTFDALAQKLAKSGIEIEWESEKPIATDDNTNSITFTIKRPGANQFKITWEFTPDHFQINFPSTDIAQYMDSYRKTVGTIIKNSSSSMLFAYRVLYALFGSNTEEIIASMRTLGEEKLSIELLFFLQPLNTNNALIALTKNLVTHIGTAINPLPLEKVILKINNTLPRDRHTLAQFFDAALDFQNPSQIELAIKLSSMQRDDVGKQELSKTLLNKKIPQDARTIELIKPLYASATEMLSTVKEIYIKDWIIRDILTKSISSSKEKEIMKPLYEWVKDTIAGFNDSDQQRAITSILHISIASPEQREQLEPWYEWIKSTFAKLNDSGKVAVIVSILSKFVNSPDERVLMQSLVGAIAKTLPTMKDDSYKIQAVRQILGKSIRSPEEIELVKPLYQAVREMLPTIKDDDKKLEAVIIICQIVILSSGVKALVKPLYEWVQDVLPTLKDDKDKYEVIRWILIKNIDSAEDRELMRPLYEAINKTLPTMLIHYAKPFAVYLEIHKSTISDLLTPEQWQRVEQFAH